MLKTDCIHQIAWSIVPAGSRSDRVELPGGLQLTRITPGSSAGGLESVLAQNTESALLSSCAELPDELDLCGGHFDRVSAAVSEFMAMSKSALTIPSLGAKMDADEATMLAKLRELAAAEGRSTEP